jgi:hypothetical protein
VTCVRADAILIFTKTYLPQTSDIGEISHYLTLVFAYHRQGD